LCGDRNIFMLQVERRCRQFWWAIFVCFFAMMLRSSEMMPNVNILLASPFKRSRRKFYVFISMISNSLCYKSQLGERYRVRTGHFGCKENYKTLGRRKPFVETKGYDSLPEARWCTSHSAGKPRVDGNARHPVLRESGVRLYSGALHMTPFLRKTGLNCSCSRTCWPSRSSALLRYSATYARRLGLG
jgi:hypothetical protein